MESKLVIGPFDLIKQIGKGSMGVVWEGVHRAQSYPVAIKVLTALGALDERLRLAFSNEVRAVARLHHPSIIRLLDYGETDGALAEASQGKIVAGSPYYAMELASGGTLPRPKAPLPWLQMRYLLLELLDALAHAHARDVIHRDIKPGNILLMHEGDQSRVMLTDFGIAKAVGMKELQDGVVAGTPRSMAPEQILNEIRDQGPWTDLYSIGCMAYQFATGERIFANATGADVLRCQLNDEPAPVTGRHLPRGFQKWLSKMLAKKVMDRYEYAAEAAWELVSLPEPELAEPEKSADIENGNKIDEKADSNEYNVVHVDGVNSAIFNTLYAPEQLSALTGIENASPMVGNVEDIADALYADMGDTVRMDSSAVVRVLAQKQRSEQIGVFKDQKLSTLAEMYRQGKSRHGSESSIPAPETWRIDSYHDHSDQLLGAGLGLWGVRAIPMVDRDAERDLIYQQLLETRSQRVVRAVVLDGPRGTGKSRIIEWMSQRAHELSLAHTLKANHYEDHLNAPGIARAIMYYLACQNLTRDKALERIQWVLGEHPLTPEYDDALPLLELMQLQDDPEHPVPGIRFNSVEEQYAVLCRFLRRICHDRASVLWLDDVHYSTYSLDFVRYMLTSDDARDLPVLILATSRSEDLEPGTSRYEAFQRMIVSPNLTKLDITPLSSQAHLELVHELIGLDEDLCEQVASRTSGMPIFAIQLIGDWVERGILVPGETGFKVKEGASIDLPDSLHELLISRIKRIFSGLDVQDKVLEQMEIAAILGVQFDADEWRIACEMAELGDNTPALNAMLEHRLFEIRYPNIRFIHELLRESFLRHAREQGRFKKYHLICADMLKSYFSTALDIYDERRAEHLYEAEAYDACLDPMLKAASLRQLKCEFGVAHTLLGKRESALKKSHVESDSPLWALGWLTDAATYLQEARLDEAQEQIERAIELGQGIQSPVVLALAYKVKGQILHLRNNVTDSLDVFMASLSFFDQIPENRKFMYLKDRAETLWLIGRVCDVRHELDLARIYLQQAIDIQSEIKDTYGLARTYKALGNTLQHGGFFEEAMPNLEYALKIFESMGYRLYIAHCLNDIGEIYRLGYQQPEQAEAYYRSAMDMYRAVNSIDSTTAVINLALLLIAKQRFNEAKSIVLSQIDKIGKTGQEFDLNWLYAELLPCCAATFDWPLFNGTLDRLSHALDISMVVDADILYCTELAANLCLNYSATDQGLKCRDIAIQQAVRLNDREAITRINNS